MTSATDNTEYKGWRKAAHEISKMTPGSFVTVKQLEYWFGAKRKSDAFNFAWMPMVDTLLEDHAICLTRITLSESGDKGWYVATDEWKATNGLDDADRAIRRRIRRQGKILRAINPENLSDEAKKRCDFYQRRNAFLQLSSDTTRRTLPATEITLRLPEKGE